MRPLGGRPFFGRQTTCEIAQTGEAFCRLRVSPLLPSFSQGCHGGLAFHQKRASGGCAFLRSAADFERRKFNRVVPVEIGLLGSGGHPACGMWCLA